MQQLFVLNGFDVHFYLHAMSQQRWPKIFCVCNALSLNYIGYESDRNDMLATGGVITFVY